MPYLDFLIEQMIQVCSIRKKEILLIIRLFRERRELIDLFLLTLL